MYLLALGTSACVSALAQNPAESALRNYGVVVAGTYVGVRCKFILGEEVDAAMKNLGVLTSALSRELRSEQVVLMHHNAAISYAQREQFAACGDERTPEGDALSSAIHVER